MTQSSTTPHQGGVQPGGGHIMLILAHANGLGVDFHQLCQGVLEAAGDGDGGAEIDVVLPQLLEASWDTEYTDAPASLTTM